MSLWARLSFSSLEPTNKVPDSPSQTRHRVSPAPSPSLRQFNKALNNKDFEYIEDKPVKDSNPVEYEEKVIEIFMKRKQELIAAMKDPKKGISIRDRSWRFKVYKTCFVASELVTWMTSNFSSIINSRPMAVKLGEALQREGVFGHVLRHHLFRDEYLFFRFVDADVEALEALLFSNPDFLGEIKDPERGVQVSDRKIGFKVYKSCFVGTDLVDWLLAKGACLSRDKAIQFGNALLIRRVFDHITQDSYFEDSPHIYYHFLRDDQSLIFAGNLTPTHSPSLPIELTKQSLEDEVKEKMHKKESKSNSRRSSFTKSPSLRDEMRTSFLGIIDNFTKKPEVEHKDLFFDLLGTEALLSCILGYLTPIDFVRCSLVSHKYRKLCCKYSQKYATYYFNRRAFDIPLSLSTLDRFAVWHGVLNNMDTMYEKHLAQLKELMYGGVPPNLRGKVWQEMLGTAAFKKKNPGLYEFCASKANESERAIGRDIGRTFPTHPDFKHPTSPGQVKLFKVLKAFANFNQEVDYCQGMNFIVGVLVMHMTEEEAFWCIVCLMKYKYFDHIYRKGLPGLLLLLNIFDQLVEQQLPSVGKAFENAGVKANTFGNKWILTLFGCVLPLPTVLRIWDMFVCDGWEIIMRVGLAILKHSEEYLVTAGFEDIFVYFDSLPPATTQMDRLFKTAFEFTLDKAIFKELSL